MTIKTQTQAIVRADTARIASILEFQASRFRQAFIDSGFLPPDEEHIPEVMEMRARGGRNLPRLLRLTSENTPLNILVRLFMLGVSVRTSIARSAMNSVPLEEWCEAGLITIDGESVEALLSITLFKGLLLATEKPELLDSGADANYVNGITLSTASLARFRVERPLDSALDLCTGCGVLAFLAARHCKRVLATDLNPRAVQLAEFNAKLNGIRNIEFAAGSSFEPAAGRKFDLITANPPCVIGPSARYTFRDSGMELDSLCRQLIRQAPDYLNEGGIFQCTVEWPNIGDADWRERILEPLQGLNCDALALMIGTKDVQKNSEETAFDTDVLDAEEQARIYNSYMDYFESRGVRTISEGLVAVRKRGGGRNWIQMDILRPRTPAEMGDAVLRYFETADAIGRLGDRLLDLKLRMGPSVSIEISRRWTGDAWEDAQYRVLQGAGFQFEAVVDTKIADLIQHCDGTTKLRDLIASLAADANIAPESIIPGCLQMIRSMLQRSFLVLPQ